MEKMIVFLLAIPLAAGGIVITLFMVFRTVINRTRTMIEGSDPR